MTWAVFHAASSVFPSSTGATLTLVASAMVAVALVGAGEAPPANAARVVVATLGACESAAQGTRRAMAQVRSFILLSLGAARPVG